MNYPGGKNGEGMSQWIINQMPPHEWFVEAFVGSGAVLRMMKPARFNIAIDCDKGLAQQLPSLFSAIPAVEIVCGDAVEWLRHFRYGREALVYCDPPYLQETRRGKEKIYRHEFNTREQHKKLLGVLLKLKCNVAISGYRSSLYDEMLHAWRRTEREVTLRHGIKATECLWMNYSEPVALHDWRYLGNTFRERERLKRIRTNLKNKLLRMPPLERRALASMIAEFNDAGLV